MDVMAWVQFITAVALLMLVARKSLWAALFFSALVLGVLAVPFVELSVVVFDTLTDPSVLLLSLSVGMIATIGGAMQRSGLIRDLVDNSRLKKKLSLVVLPAVIGFLAIPGGALLSAPVVERAAPGASGEDKATVNIWSRHIAVLIYPMGTLLATTKMADVGLYEALLYLLPGTVLLMFLIWFILMRRMGGWSSPEKEPSLKRLLVPVLVILVAPAVHASLMYLFPEVLGELFLFLGVTLSLLLSFVLGGLSFSKVPSTIRMMRSQNFALIILGMFVFLNVFNSTRAPYSIASLPLSLPVLIVFAGGVLGFATGRVNVPISILVPILHTRFGENSVTVLVFSVMYFAIFIGFLISPVHPCVTVSLEFFRTTYTGMIKKAMVPAAVAWATTLLVALILL